MHVIKQNISGITVAAYSCCSYTGISSFMSMLLMFKTTKPPISIPFTDLNLNEKDSIQLIISQGAGTASPISNTNVFN